MQFTGIGVFKLHISHATEGCTGAIKALQERDKCVSHSFALHIQYIIHVRTHNYLYVPHIRVLSHDRLTPSRSRVFEVFCEFHLFNCSARGKCCIRCSEFESRGKCQIYARTMTCELIISPIINGDGVLSSLEGVVGFWWNTFWSAVWCF